MDARYYHINLTGDDPPITLKADEMKTCKGFLEFYLNSELVAKYAQRSLKGYRIVELGSIEHSTLDMAHG